jgi:hypothetical protein
MLPARKFALDVNEAIVPSPVVSCRFLPLQKFG